MTTPEAGAAAHTSQSEGLPTVMRRLNLLDSREALRWLLLPQPVPSQRDEENLALPAV